MFVMQLLFKRIKIFPHFLFLIFKDLFSWIAHRGWTVFEEFGLHIYVAKFGQGKTCSMVRDAYNLCCRYKGLTVLTNISLSGFPEDTKIVPLKTAQDILNAPDNTIVLIDEIGTIFNSRDFNSAGNGKRGGVPKPVFQMLCQCRHRHIVIYGTTQDWMFLDKQLRQISADVTVCSAWLHHPFSRMITNRVYDAREYTMFFDNPMLPLTEISVDCYVQTDKLRSLYDTKEMVATMLTMEYIDDKEILASQSDLVAPSYVPTDKKEQNKLVSKLRKGGL